MVEELYFSEVSTGRALFSAFYLDKRLFRQGPVGVTTFYPPQFTHPAPLCRDSLNPGRYLDYDQDVPSIRRIDT